MFQFSFWRLAAMLMLALAPAAARAQTAPTDAGSPGTTIFIQKYLAEEKLKLDVRNGSGSGLHMQQGTFTNTTLLGLTTAVTPDPGSNDNEVATAGFAAALFGSSTATETNDKLFLQSEVDAANANILALQQTPAVVSGAALSDAQCQIVQVGATQVLSFAAGGSACFDLTLTQPNPVMAFQIGHAGRQQSLTAYVHVPAAGAVPWTLPSAVSGGHVDYTGAPCVTAGCTTIIDAKSPDGGLHVYGNAELSTNGQVAPVVIAGAMLLDSLPNELPNRLFAQTATCLSVCPSVIDVNFGLGWITSAPFSQSGSVMTITQSTGLPAGSYIPQIRDHNNTSNIATAGKLLVDAWSETALISSPAATAVYVANIQTPGIAATDSNGNLVSLGNALNGQQYLSPRLGAANAAAIRLAALTGQDGLHKSLVFQPTKLSPNTADPVTNWLSAAGHAPALTALTNCTNVSLSTCAWTVAFSITLDFSKGYTYAAGPIWGSPASPGPLQYAQWRWNSGPGNFSAQITDATGAAISRAVAATAGTHTIVMAYAGGTMIMREEGAQVGTQTGTPSGSLSTALTGGDFMFGGGFAPGASGENGVPPSNLYYFSAFSGSLSNADIAKLEQVAGNAAGEPITSTFPAAPVAMASSIGVNNPGTQTAGSAFIVGGTEGGTSAALAEQVNVGGVAGTWTPLAMSGVTQNGSTYSFSQAGLSTAASVIICIRDVNNSTVATGCSSAFAVAAPAATTTVATSFTADTPSWLAPSATYSFAGGYAGVPQALNVSTDGGKTYAAAPSATISNGRFSIPLSAPSSNTTLTLCVQDAKAPGVTACSGTVTVNAWSPGNLGSSAGTSGFWAMDSTREDLSPAAADGSVATAANALAPSQYLTAVIGSASGKILATRQSGADGKHRVFTMSPNTSSSYATSGTGANYWAAGGATGPAGPTLVSFMSTSNVQNGNWTVIETVKLGSATFQNLFLAELPSPLQYNQMRVTTNYSLNYRDAGSGSGAAAGGTIAQGYATFSAQKTGSLYILRRNGLELARYTAATSGSLAPADFALGALIPSGGSFVGNPPAQFSGFEAFQGSLSAADLSMGEHYSASSAGVTF